MKMRVFHCILLIEAVLFLVGAVIFAFTAAFELRSEEKELGLDKKQQGETTFIVYLAVALAVAFQIYVFLCINSLTLNIKDENSNSGRAGSNSAAFMNPQKPANEYPSQVAITMN